MRVIAAVSILFLLTGFCYGGISLYDEYGNPFGIGVAISAGDIHEPVELNIYSDDDSDWTGYLVLDYFYNWDDAELNNPRTFYPNAGGNGTNSEFSQAGVGIGYEFVSETRITYIGGGPGGGTTFYQRPSAGIQHAADFVLSDIGMYYVSLYDGSNGFNTPVDYLKIYCGADPGYGAYSVIDGSYSVDIGDTITLSGRHSFYVDELVWRIQGNVIGYNEMQEISYDTLVNTFGLTPGTYQVELYTLSFDYNKGELYEDYAYSELTILPEPASFALLFLGGLLLRKR